MIVLSDSNLRQSDKTTQQTLMIFRITYNTFQSSILPGIRDINCEEGS